MYGGFCWGALSFRSVVHGIIFFPYIWNTEPDGCLGHFKDQAKNLTHGEKQEQETTGYAISQQELSFTSVWQSNNLSQLSGSHSPPTGRWDGKDKVTRKEIETCKAAQHRDHRYAVMGCLQLNYRKSKGSTCIQLKKKQRTVPFILQFRHKAKINHHWENWVI